MICAPNPILFGRKIEKNELGGACRAYGERRDVYRALVGKPDEKNPLGRPRRLWEDKINHSKTKRSLFFKDPVRTAL
jgi:hypothetical protein